MMDRLPLQFSDIVVFETGFRFNTDLFISLFVGFTFEFIHYRVQDTRFFTSQNEQQKIVYFQRKIRIQKEKISKYFEKLVLQVLQKYISLASSLV